jgi:subtilisin-like proprotein convertase family protein
VASPTRSRLNRLRQPSAILVIALLMAPGIAQAKTKTFTSGPVNMPIPDAVGNNMGTEVLNSIKVKPRGTVKDVNVAVRITHPDSTDLTLSLYHRTGAVNLADVRPKDGTALSPDYGAGAPACAGAVFTTFDDAAPLSIATATSPFAGAVRPEAGLRQLNGTSLKGGWQLGVLDGYTNQVGTLNCWRVTVRYKPAKRKRNKS